MRREPHSEENSPVNESEYQTLGEPPAHIAIIMDGNGRWAKRHGLPRNEGHRRGVEKVRRILTASFELGVKFLTAYAFSVENWNRPQGEVGMLMSLLGQFLKRQVGELHRNRVRLRVIGRIDELPKFVQGLLRETIEGTAHYQDRTFVLALNYGSRTEIVDAVKAYARALRAGRVDPETLEWNELRRYLYTGDIPDPDLIIRTSGESRLSNFLLLQGAYSEFYLSPKLWPDFGPEDLKDVIENFRQRERRFGKTGEQVRQSRSALILNR